MVIGRGNKVACVLGSVLPSSTDYDMDCNDCVDNVCLINERGHFENISHVET